MGAAFAASLATTQPAEAADSLVIRDFVPTHGIYEREPVGTTETFASSDQRGYVFARISNEGMPTQINFDWYYGNEMHARVPMNIGTSNGWRTWSSINLRPGNWHVKLTDQNGMVIAERAFMVEHSGGMSAGSSGNKDSYGGWTGQKNPG